VAAILVAAALDAATRWRSGSDGATLATIFQSRASALAHAPRFYDRATADAMFDEISQYAGLNFTSYLIEGARVRSPRRMMWCAEGGVGEYRFSANHVPGLRAHPFTPTLRRMRRDVEKAVGAPFNAVLINLYADGTEHAAWHADDDPWLGRDFDVPSLSLGAARPFRTRRRGDVNETTVTLGHGSLLVMKGAFQREYEHSLPRTRGVGVRINLTWRFVAPALRHLHNLKPSVAGVLRHGDGVETHTPSTRLTPYSHAGAGTPMPRCWSDSEINAYQAATSTTTGDEIGKRVY